MRGFRSGRWLVLLGTAGAITASCGAAERNEESIDLDTVFEVLIANLCREDCSTRTLIELIYNQDCLEMYGVVYESVRAGIERSLDSGATSFDAAQAQRCIDDLAQAECVVGPASTACEAMFVGHVPEGGACLDSMECAGGGYCSEAMTCPRVCEPTLAAGARCDEGGACAAGLACSPEGVCEVPRANGEPCAESANCLSEYCHYDTLVCTAVPVNFATAEGQPCDWTYECQLGLFCNEALAQPVCVPAPKLGEPCTDIGGSVSCANGAFCHFEADGTEGVCVERAPVGGPCEESEECATMICDGGTCQEYSRLGEPCVTNARCFGVCDAGVCASPMPACD